MVIAALLLLLAGQPASTEVVAEIIVHGNSVTSNDQLRALTGVAIGSPFTNDVIPQVTARLRATKRFKDVEVRKRLRSIADPSQIVLVVIVDEGPVSIKSSDDGTARAVRSQPLLGMMLLPIINFDDDYGFTYGVRLARADVAGPRSRLSFPLAWGGQKQAGVELEKYLDQGPLTRVEARGGLLRRTNPFYQQEDDRERVSLRGERRFTPWFMAGATGGWQHVSFLGQSDNFTSIGGDVTVDTRIDPMLSRNAVFARAGIMHIDTHDYGPINRTDLEGRGYIGLVGPAVLVVRGLRTDSDRPLPPYLQALRGGTSNVRGFRPGSAVADTLVAGSAEVRAPITSPLRVAKLGVSAFFDVAASYNKGQQLADQPFYRGVGGAVWLHATVIHVGLGVAHGIGGDTRVLLGSAVQF